MYGFLGWLILAFSASQQKRSINCPFSSGLVVEKLSRTPESPIPNDVSFSYKNEPWNEWDLKYVQFLNSVTYDICQKQSL